MCVHWLVAGLLLAAPTSAQSVTSGIEAWGRSDYAAALAAWRPLAAKGNPDAMFNLGQAYRLGRGVPIDLVQAQEWYERAAEANHVGAQTQLGMLLFGTGIRADGLRWLKAAADKGEPRAQLLYGTALFNGDGVAREPLAAYRYISTSAAQGLAAAKTTLTQLNDVMSADLRRAAVDGGSLPPAQSSQTRAPMPAAIPSASTAAPLAVPVSGRWRVQLGAFSQQASAEKLFYKYADGPLVGRAPFFLAVGGITRLQVGPFPSHAEAAKTCAVLAGRGQPCFVVPAPR